MLITGRTISTTTNTIPTKHTLGQLKRSCVELAKQWRTDKYLRQLNAVSDGRHCTSQRKRHAFLCAEMFEEHVIIVLRWWWCNSMHAQKLWSREGSRTQKYLVYIRQVMLVTDKDTSLTVTGNGDVLEPADGIIGGYAGDTQGVCVRYLGVRG